MMRRCFAIRLRFARMIAVTLRCLVAIAVAGVAAVHADIPQRIVSLSPHATELLFSVGAGNRVVAVSESCDFPEAARRLPKVSGYRGTNVEAVIALRPDLVVAWPGGNRAADLDALRRLGVRVYDSEIDTLTGILAEVRRFSEWATDDDGRRNAMRQANEATAQVLALQRRYGSARRVRVFYQLGAGRLFTLSDRHLVGEALAVCGAENVFGRLQLPAPEVSPEAVLAAKPDAVLVAAPGSLIAVRQQWQSARLFDAGRTRARVVEVDGARLHRPTLRTFAAVQALCESIDRVRQTLH